MRMHGRGRSRGDGPLVNTYARILDGDGSRDCSGRLSGSVEQLQIDDFHRGASDVVYSMREWLDRTCIREHLTRRNRTGLALRFPKSLAGGRIDGQLDSGAIARVNVVRRTLPGRQRRMDYHHVQLKNDDIVVI